MQHLMKCLRYIKATKHFAICISYNPNYDNAIMAFTDASHATTNKKENYTGGAIFCFGSICQWMSVKQRSVTTNVAAAEYIAASTVGEEALASLYLLQEIEGFVDPKATETYSNVKILIDNEAALRWVKGLGLGKSRKVQIRYHWVRSACEEGLITISHIPGTVQCADLLTKVMTRAKIELFLAIIGLLMIESRQTAGGVLK